MFTKIGVTLATGALPALLWTGAASAQQSQSQSQQSQSQSQQTQPTVSTLPTTTNTGGGTLARTGAEDVLPLAAGGAVLAGAIAYFGVRRRSVT